MSSSKRIRLLKGAVATTGLTLLAVSAAAQVITIDPRYRDKLRDQGPKIKGEIEIRTWDEEVTRNAEGFIESLTVRENLETGERTLSIELVTETGAAPSICTGVDIALSSTDESYPFLLAAATAGHLSHSRLTLEARQLRTMPWDRPHGPCTLQGIRLLAEP